MPYLPLGRTVIKLSSVLGQQLELTARYTPLLPLYSLSRFYFFQSEISLSTHNADFVKSSSKKTEIEKVELDKDREENSAKAKTTRSTVKEAKAEEIPAFKNAGTGPTDTVNASPKKAEMSGTFPVDDWTDELDEKLVKLKEDGKSWPDIVSSLGKPKKQVTKRYGELMREKKNRNKKKYGGSSSRVKDEESESKAKRKAEEGEEFPSMIDFTVGTDPGDDIKLFTSGEPFQEVDGQDLSAQDVS